MFGCIKLFRKTITLSSSFLNFLCDQFALIRPFFERSYGTMCIQYLSKQGLPYPVRYHRYDQRRKLRRKYLIQDFLEVITVKFLVVTVTALGRGSLLFRTVNTILWSLRLISLIRDVIIKATKLVSSNLRTVSVKKNWFYQTSS